MKETDEDVALFLEWFFLWALLFELSTVRARQIQHQETLIQAIPFWDFIFYELSRIVYLSPPRNNYYSRQ